MNPCRALGCHREAVNEVCLSLRAHEHQEPLITAPLFYVCAEHADLKWEVIINEERWRKVCQVVLKAGKMPPNKKFSYLLVRRIGFPDCPRP